MYRLLLLLLKMPYAGAISGKVIEIRKLAIQSQVDSCKMETMVNMKLVHIVIFDVEVFKPLFAHGCAHDDTAAILWLLTI